MDTSELAQSLADTMREGSAAEALLLIALQSDLGASASAISSAVNTLYKSYRDVGSMLVVAHLGVTWCLGQAALRSDPEVATALRRRAHAMSFNSAANCWPGWGDEGVVIDDGHVKSARSLAGICLALAQQLELGPKGIGTAHWLIGALELALGHWACARAAFDEAQRSYAALGEAAPQRLMAQGYDALAAYCGDQSSDETASALKDLLERLSALGTEDGQFFADQIERADRVLRSRRAP